MYTGGCEGQPLVEVFGVRFHGGEAPAGTVSVFDGKRGQIIYSGSPVDKPSSRQTQRPGGRLPLTGPYRAISADRCVAIVLDLHHGRHDTASSSSPTSSPSSYVTEILLDVYDEATRYDELTTRSDGRGAELTYALLSDAAEAIIEVKLLRPRASGGRVGGGTVVARTNVGEVVLFEDDDGASVGTDGVVPLARSVLAVLLTVVVDLVAVDRDGEETVKESVRMYTGGCEGQPLVEVLGVRFHGGEAPAGTISVFDGKRGQIIYSGSPVDKPSSRQTQRPGGRLPLTGPYRAVSADGCVAIVLDLHHRRHDTASSSSPTSSPSSYVTEILLDVYDEATRYDEPTTRSDGRGAEVTYALLGDAAEAIIEVKLLRPRASGGRVVGGTVVARTNVGKVVLFEDDDGASGTDGVVPLARSVVAVPLTSLLTVLVDLVAVDGDGEEAVKESVVCVPKLGSEEVCRRPTTDGVGAVEVKVTWLD